jgi:hypothetical protein
MNNLEKPVTADSFRPDRRSFLKGVGALSLAPTLALASEKPPVGPGRTGRLKVYRPRVVPNSIYFAHPAHVP